MKTYACHGHREFILCLGYKGDMIKDYFRNYLWNTCDVTLKLGHDSEAVFHNHHDEEDWSVTLADTGENSMTAWRVKQIKRYIPAGESFLLTYGDGVSSVDINQSIASHRSSGKVCTITAVHPAGRFGSMRVEQNGAISSFDEKPQFEKTLINGGYMVCEHSMFNYLPDDPSIMLERYPMERLVADGQLNAYRHTAFGNQWILTKKHNISIICGRTGMRRGKSGKQWYTIANKAMSELFHDIFRNSRVLVTGHTGFKGSWLCEWLINLGAEVHGYALDPLPHAVLFDKLKLNERLAADHRADILDKDRLAAITRELTPDFVFHLAAQPLVRLSYQQPVETFAINVMGSVHMLDALRRSGHPCTAVMVTTDKCYENRDWIHPYREDDQMGGYDPYSASKGAAEIAIAAWRRSFSHAIDAPIRIASARAGNVIGGGDWAPDRIVPDAIRAVLAGRRLSVRNPDATRPWQHVLEPLSGYLQLAAKIHAKARGYH